MNASHESIDDLTSTMKDNIDFVSCVIIVFFLEHSKLFFSLTCYGPPCIKQANTAIVYVNMPTLWATEYARITQYNF